MKIIIDIDTDQQSIVIEDNACGVNKEELTKLISPGETSSDGIEGAIGVFGVGSKRAVVALAQNIQISTRNSNHKTHRIKYDDEWLDSDDWHVTVYEVDDIDENTTRIELSNLRFKIDENLLQDLREHLEIIYANFVEDGKVQIWLDGSLVAGKFFTQWAFPPDFSPTKFTKTIIDYKTKREVQFELTYGLTHEKGSIGGDYGVFIYCNKRLVTRALKSPEVGFIAKMAGVPHPDQSLARVIVSLAGSSDLMPWISSKRGINYNHDIFKVIKEEIIDAVTHSTSMSRRLKRDSETTVEPYKEGTIVEKHLSITEKIKSKLSPLPKMRKTYKDNILTLNKALGSVKIWTKGLYESMIAEELISREKTLTQKNRISLILLDSTIEIGCKEFLINEVGVSKAKVLSFKRKELHEEVEKHILKGDAIWGRFNRYYQIRNKFIHESADLTVWDNTIRDLRNDVKVFLNTAFGIQFPS